MRGIPGFEREMWALKGIGDKSQLGSCEPWLYTKANQWAIICNCSDS